MKIKFYVTRVKESDSSLANWKPIATNRSDESSSECETTEAKFIDFGNSYIMHPAYDILYFLYTTTDRGFRQSHFDALLRNYFATFSTYFSGDDDLSYGRFKKETEEMREGVMIFTSTVRIYYLAHFRDRFRFEPFRPQIQLVPTMLCPIELKLKTFGDVKESIDFRDKVLPARDQEDDHPMLREIRRRLVDMLEELAEMGSI